MSCYKQSWSARIVLALCMDRNLLLWSKFFEVINKIYILYLHSSFLWLKFYTMFVPEDVYGGSITQCLCLKTTLFGGVNSVLSQSSSSINNWQIFVGTFRLWNKVYLSVLLLLWCLRLPWSTSCRIKSCCTVFWWLTQCYPLFSLQINRKWCHL